MSLNNNAILQYDYALYISISTVNSANTTFKFMQRANINNRIFVCKISAKLFNFVHLNFSSQDAGIYLLVFGLK
jgi:hypothetical protein